MRTCRLSCMHMVYWYKQFHSHHGTVGKLRQMTINLFYTRTVKVSHCWTQHVRGYSSVAEHSTADREVTGSTPVAPFLALINFGGLASCPLMLYFGNKLFVTSEIT
jgi:hypothetical protein